MLLFSGLVQLSSVFIPRDRYIFGIPAGLFVYLLGVAVGLFGVLAMMHAEGRL